MKCTKDKRNHKLWKIENKAGIQFMAKLKNDGNWTEERKRFLLRTAQENPQIFEIKSMKSLTELEGYFSETSKNLGVSTAECARYYSFMHSKYLREKKKLLDGKKLKNNWPFLEDFQQIEAAANHMICHTHELSPKIECSVVDMAPRPNVFLAKNPNNEQSIVKMEGAYDNVAFNSGSSDEEEEFLTEPVIKATLNDNQTKRPLSLSRRKKSVFRKAGEYIVAELENMEPQKAELLMNKTLKFFVEHRYD